MLSVDDVFKTRKVDDMATTRKNRYIRTRPTTKLNLAETGYEVLELLHQFKALRTQHIALHLPHRHERGLVHSLRNLFDHGLLDKVDAVRRFNALYQSDVYTLTDKGRDALVGRDVPPRLVLSDAATGFDINHEWDHSMMIIDLLSNLVAGAKRRGIRIISAEELAEQATVAAPFKFPLKSTHRDRKTGKLVPHIKKPDGIIGLYYPQGVKAYFAIEAEHNKPRTRADDEDFSKRQASSRKTILQYLDLDWRRVYQNLNIRNMRVLVVAPTATQTENIVKVAAVAKGKDFSSERFLLHWLPVVSGEDVPVMPEIFDATWMRIGLEPEHINAPSHKARAVSAQSHSAQELRSQA